MRRKRLSLAVQFSSMRTSYYISQKNEKITQVSIRSTVIGTAKVITYDDIVQAQIKRDIKEAVTTGAKRGSRKRQNPATGKRERSPAEELEHGRRETEALGLDEYCSVL